jgi:hypothetical protein
VHLVRHLTALVTGTLANVPHTMIGFRVTMSDGSTRLIEADAHWVDESGDLIISGGGAEVLECHAGEWVMVDVLGTQLVEHWPPDDLHYLVASVAEERAVRFGHYVHQPQELQRFEDWRMNDLDSLSAQLLATVPSRRAAVLVCWSCGWA